MNARILIVDDNPVSRVTLRELLDWHSFQVCGDAQNGKEAIEKVIELRPDIVLMDINMPEMNGIKAAREIPRIAPITKIVFLTVHDTPAVMVGTRMWAHGCVPKSAAGVELIKRRLTASKRLWQQSQKCVGLGIPQFRQPLWVMSPRQEQSHPPRSPLGQSLH